MAHEQTRKQEEHLEATRRYYDAFATGYERQRGGAVDGGYHDLIDRLELGFLARYATGQHVLEVGCGTGLLLEGIEDFAASAKGIDLSPGMLDKARARGLDVMEASATALPFEDDCFDVTCSFKVLAHVADIRRAMSEMVRVTRPGGHVVAELYNRNSLRTLIKRYGPSGQIARAMHEGDVYTRFDSPDDVARLVPRGARIIDRRGIRIFTPFAGALRLPVVGKMLRRAETRLCDSSLAAYGGFYVVAIEVDGEPQPEPSPLSPRSEQRR